LRAHNCGARSRERACLEPFNREAAYVFMTSPAA
jgi:hypothetical protein